MTSTDRASGERWDEIQRAVDGALDLPPEERDAYLDAACGAGTALRQRVARLLKACERAERVESLLDAPAAEFAAPMLADLAAHDAPDSPRLAVARSALQQALSGRYVIERELGRGGMATVFLAQDVRHSRPVAIKMMAPEGLAQHGAQRFLREIRTAARLTHPHVLGVHDSGDADGLLYYVMPYIPGETLRARMARDGALPLPDALRLLRELADALGYAHAHGVVHRDLKPENILLSDGHAVVADFGIARALAVAAQADPEPGTGFATAGVVLGTPGYMAPEQARGAVTDHRADLYSLGVVTYEMLAGTHPFGPGAAPGSIAAPLGDRRPDVPHSVVALVAHLVAMDPESRPESADAVLQLLDGVGDVHGGSATPTSRGERRSPVRRRMLVLATAAMLLTAAALAVVRPGWRAGGSAVPRPGIAATPAVRPSVAVLPFENTSGDPADDAFSDGLTDELIGALGQVPGLRVTGRTSAFALKGRRLGVRAVAETLGVSAVVEGSFRRSGGRLRVGAQLVSAPDGAVLWAGTWDREAADVFDLQEDLARAIVLALRGRLTAGQPASNGLRPTGDLAAYEHYLRGRYILHGRNSRDAIRAAIRYYEQAVEQDPSFAHAHAGLADAYARLGALGHGPPAAEFARSRTAALRALELDGTVPEAHVALAHVLFASDFDWVESERAFRRAVALDPSNVHARVLFAIPLQDQGRVDEALAQLDTAHAVDPLAPLVNVVRGRVYVNARRPADAIGPLTEALTLSPDLDLAYQQLGIAYLQLGRHSEAIAALQRAAALSGIRDSALLAYGYAATGRRADAERTLRRVLESSAGRYVPPFPVAVAYAGLGDADAAFSWLERGYEERGSFMDGVAVTSAFAPLHRDRRWRPLLRRMRLER